MVGDGIGSSVIIALAALMWFLYLVPTWFKRREYLATERNAVRLQQTMRILAESAELPSVVRVEATARTVAAQQRALRQQQRRLTARAESALDIRAQRWVDAGARTRRRLRRSRALASFVLLAAIVGAGFGVAAVGQGNWLLLAVSVAVGVGSVALLAQAATVTRARAELRRAASASVTQSALHDEADHEPVRRPGWTPVPLPKPLYLSRGRTATGQSVQHDRLETAGTSHAAALRAASAEAERALRAAQSSPSVARIDRGSASERPAAAGQFATERFANMGIIDPSPIESADLDEILRRRRAVG